MGLLCNPYVKFTLRTLVVVLILAVSAIATGPPVPRPSKQTKGVRTFSGYGYIKVSAREWPFHPGAKPAGWLTDSGGWTQALRPRGLFLADVKSTYAYAKWAVMSEIHMCMESRTKFVLTRP